MEALDDDDLKDVAGGVYHIGYIYSAFLCAYNDILAFGGCRHDFGDDDCTL